MSKPRLLDLFCGAGGAAMGYARAGFEVVGVDIDADVLQHYPFECIRSDALRVLEYVRDGFTGYDGFDAIHASPPCQAYTTMNNRHGSDSPALIATVRELLLATGLPYVIENVPGAKAHLRSPVRITGSSVGIAAERPRYYETNWPLLVAPPGQLGPTVAVYGKNDQRRLWTRTDGSELRAATLEEGRAALGIDWMTWDELREAVPPRHTELIGHQLAHHVLLSDQEQAV